jgi:hypothetical protein
VRGQLCLWCGVRVVLIMSNGGQAIAQQCPLCLDSAPVGKPVGKEPEKPKAPTRAEQKLRRAVKVAKKARQGELFQK